MSLLRLPINLMALVVQSVLLALGQIWTNKLRSFLTTLGIILGVASVTAVIAALTGLKTSVLKEFESFGTNKMFVQPRWPETGHLKRASWNIIRFTPSQFDGLLDHCPSVKSLTRQCQYNARVRFSERTVENVPIVGIEPSWHEIENRTVTLGRHLSTIDVDQLRQVCLISPDLRDKLRLDRDCIGMSIYIGLRPFQVIGLIEPRPQSAMFGGGRRESEVFIPFSTAWNLEQPWMYAVAASKSTDVSEEAAAEMRFFLRRSRQLKPGEPDTFEVIVIEEFVRQFDQIALMTTLVAGAIVGISLLVGGVGIMNIMLVSVSERTREIGLRKAVGARPSAILLQFLIEAVVLCVVGGAMGLGVGQLFTVGLAGIPQTKLQDAFIPVWAIAVALGFSTFVGLLFGFFPALKAAQLDPIEALRHE